jgi:hypothetical protein
VSELSQERLSRASIDGDHKVGREFEADLGLLDDRLFDLWDCVPTVGGHGEEVEGRGRLVDGEPVAKLVRIGELEKIATIP